MANPQNESVDSILKECAERIRDIVRAEVRAEIRDELVSAIMATGVKVVPRAPVRAKPRAHANGIKPAPSKPRAKPKLAPKPRTKGDVTAMAAKVLTYINDNPGKRSEEIARATDYSTKELKAPLRMLVKEDKIKFSGKARGTAYTAK